MGGAVYALIVNTCVAVLFATSFSVIALMFRQRRGARWFAVSYFIGALTPISELGVRFSDWTSLFMISSYCSFLVGTLLMSVALDLFGGRRPHWRAVSGILVAGLVLRAILWGGVRDTMPYEILYQLPFAAALALAAIVAFGLSRQRGLSLAMALSVVLAVISLHFLIKPFAASAFGSGLSAKDYAGSAYALFSQATTGVLLITAGLLVLLLVAQDAMATTLYDAETDPLTLLHNRRGFFRRASILIEQARQDHAPLSAIMLDLDHFKRVNDTYGHATGDAVLRAFADCLRAAVPGEAVVGRLGGEEFAVMLPQRTIAGAQLTAHAIVIAMEDFPARALPSITVSGGLSQLRVDDGIDDLIDRADAEAYAAKAAGRGRIHPVLGDDKRPAAYPQPSLPARLRDRP